MCLIASLTFRFRLNTFFFFFLQEYYTVDGVHRTSSRQRHLAGAAPCPGSWLLPLGSERPGTGDGCRACPSLWGVGGRTADGAEKSPARPLAPVAALDAKAPASAALAVACSPPSPPSLSVGNSSVGDFVSKFKVENYDSRMGFVCLSYQ